MKIGKFLSLHTLLTIVSSLNQLPLILIFFKQFLLLWTLALLWKKLVFLSPSFSHSSLDLCLQETSSNRDQYLKFSLAKFHSSKSLKDSGLFFPKSSHKLTLSEAFHLFTFTLPKTSIFQDFRKAFKSFTLKARIKLQVPLKLKLCN